ncbi:AAA family ATPase [Actinomadura sp. NPDC047616]|uniref:ATP-binding protein n=1 Tax=Actinomadura sp. NPDC047616 TaxID=3155914 RepID=UPI0033D8CCD9
MTSTLIGREHPAAVLRGEVDRAVASHGGLVLVAGEAGIGKTTLVTEAMREARDRGALVLGGSCWDSASAPGYWPWTQVVRALRRAVDAREWAAAEAAAGGGLAVLLGESPGADADGFQVYDAVTSALVAVSQRRPVAVALDDLHWADAASVRLLEFVAQHTWFERLLLIGTYRDVEVEWDEHPLRSLLPSLAAKATVVTLTGLGRAEVGRLMHRTVGVQPDDALVAEVHRRTGGNPFFVEQAARLWHGGGTVNAIAPGVQDAVRRRLSLLPGAVARLLTSAAVLGREFDRGVLAAAMGEPVPRVERLLARAVAARLVVARDNGRFAFAHDLVRETLYGTLGDVEARRAHAAVVRAIDDAPALAGRVMPAELARHAHLAGDEIDATRAVEHLRAAARDARRRSAVEESIGHLRRALERAPAGHGRLRVLLSLELGRQLSHAGDEDAAWQVFERAVALSREVDDTALLARAALTLYPYEPPGPAQRLRDELLVEAHRRMVLDGAAPPVRRPLIQLAQELSAAVARQARGGDDETLVFSLWARHDALLGVGTAAERLALTEELFGLARRTGDMETAYLATSFRWVALLEQGDPRYLEYFHRFVTMARGADADIWHMGASADECVIGALHGRFAEAERHADALLTGETCGAGSGLAYMAFQFRWMIQLLQGRFEELEATHRALYERDHPYAELLEAVTAVQRGDTDLALRHLTAMQDREEPYPPVVASLWLRFQAQAAAASGDPRRCERARSALLPYAGLWAVALHGCEVSGPMDLWLGELDAAQGRWDDAVRRFTAARESADRLLARPWSVEARLRLAESLLARGAAGDAQAARGLLAEVTSEAADMDMRHIPARAARALSAVDAPERIAGRAAPAPAPSRARGSTAAPATATASTRTLESAVGGDGGVFRFDGAVWTLSFASRTVHMPDAKGLRDLHVLLGSPGTEIPAVRLANPAGGPVAEAALRGGGDPVLDEEAKARYRRRLLRLDEEIDRAAALGDDGRAAEFDRERAALLAELRAAAGPAGRDRRLGDQAERARKAVTARIRDTLRRLDRRHPELARHLRATVSTGLTCAYRPDSDVTWRL